MRRREFISFLGGAVTAWPVRARGQAAERMRLIGVLLPIAKDDPDYQPWLTAFRQVLQQQSWQTCKQHARLAARPIYAPGYWAHGWHGHGYGHWHGWR